VADRAIQVFGGNGYMTEMGVERWARLVRAMRLYEGTSEILKTNIARTLGLDEATRAPAPAAGPAPTP
jgi:acyl-CoA dehydrogenase